jgi:uncharacterized RDD family membrane protein YckC
MTVLLNSLKRSRQENSPSLPRRMASFFYEGLLLWGILIFSGILGGVIYFSTGQYFNISLRIFTFLLYGWYFVWFWSSRGQTLPMQTWKIRLVTSEGKKPNVARSIMRYLACYVWLGVTALVIYFNNWTGKNSLVAFSVGLFLYLLIPLLHPERKFWHDVVCGTKLINSESCF